MNSSNFSRRQFLQSALYSSVILGAGGIPQFVPRAKAAGLSNNMLVNLFLSGGPDMRHLVVPAYSDVNGSFGDKYWSNRTRSHSLATAGQTAQQRYEQDYVEIEVGDSNWNSQSLVDSGSLNTGIKFGIWKEAGWLIDMFQAGNVAMVFNAVGGQNRAHDLSSLMLNQGNLLSSLNDRSRSGWGGRLARSAGGNSIALTPTPSSFCFGPLGAAPDYDPDAIDNIDLLAVENSREIGLFDFDPASNQHNNSDDKKARASKNYYAALRQEQVPEAYQKFLQHESKSREFGDLISERLEGVEIPELIQALYSNVDSINPDPNNANNNGRRVLRRTSLGIQVRNLFDLITLGDVITTGAGGALEQRLGPRVMSMSYGGWDSHGGQRRIPNVLASDPNNPFETRGIESGFRDIFGGQIGNASPVLHGAFSALWDSLSQADQNQMVFTCAGEFGRQIRDNGDAGTDHGKGNLMLIIGSQVRGGVYGEMFPVSEIPKYDEPSNRRPDIDPRTEIDQFFSQVCEWVAPGSGVSVFPRMDPGYSGEPPMLETGVTFNNLFS